MRWTDLILGAGHTPSPFLSSSQLLPFSFISQIMESSRRPNLDELSHWLYALAIILVRGPKGPLSALSSILQQSHLRASSALQSESISLPPPGPSSRSHLSVSSLLLVKPHPLTHLSASVFPHLCSCSCVATFGARPGLSLWEVEEKTLQGFYLQLVSDPGHSALTSQPDSASLPP